MSFERPENIRSKLDLSHLDRMSRPPEEPHPELPLWPEIEPSELVEGPRMPLRYGSAPITIWWKQGKWKRADIHYPSFGSKWRPLSEMEIELLSWQGAHGPRSIHRVASVVPHGGNYDDHLQFVLTDGTHVPFSKARWARDDDDC